MCSLSFHILLLSLVFPNSCLSLLPSSFFLPPNTPMASLTHASTTPLLRPLTSPTALFHAPCSRTYVCVSFPSCTPSNHLAIRPTTHLPIYQLTHPPFTHSHLPFDMHPTLLSAFTPTRELETPQRNVKEATTREVLFAKNENSATSSSPPPLAPATTPRRFYLSPSTPSAPPIECRLAAGWCTFALLGLIVPSWSR